MWFTLNANDDTSIVKLKFLHFKHNLSYYFFNQQCNSTIRTTEFMVTRIQRNDGFIFLAGVGLQTWLSFILSYRVLQRSIRYDKMTYLLIFTDFITRYILKEWSFFIGGSKIVFQFLVILLFAHLSQLATPNFLKNQSYFWEF